MRYFLIRALALVVVFILPAGIAQAAPFEFEKTLRKGDQGRPVRALQMRVAAWYPDHTEVFTIDGEYGGMTVRAVRALEEAYGLKVDGVAGKDVFEVLEDLQDPDGSTAHFDWEEFQQNSSSTCGAKANAYANTLSGGVVSPKRTKLYVRRLMWRLEALRKKAGGKAIGINSGFRSVAYNDCIGGARASQHMYGTAADARQVKITNRRQRWLARKSQFHGIGCYSSQTHNHLDLRMDNKDLPSQQHVWWPEKDSKGRELDEAGIPCWGEAVKSKQTLSLSRALGSAVSLSVEPSGNEIGVFAEEGEAILPSGLLPEGVD
jgi:zinc D-Ala-D-Ala carboxypeptidase